MMKFEFNTPSRIFFGRGEIARLAEVGPPFGSVALVIHAGEEDSPDLLRVKRILEGKQIKLKFVRQRGEPKVEDVNGTVEKARRVDCDWVIGIGGGSAIDMAKAVAGVMGNGGGALDYLEVVGKGKKLTKPAAPWIAIPTTAGTGAEATRNAVLTAGTFKASMRSELLLPRVAIVDPELGGGIPPQVIASSGMDALCQLVESYTSNGATGITDALALRGIEMATASLLKSCQNPGEIEFREPMSLAAMFSGITLTNAGLGAVHGFAAPLGAHFPIPHGVICAALMPPVINANVLALRSQNPDHPTLERYATIGRIIAREPAMRSGPAIVILEAFADKLIRDLKIPPLHLFGLTESHIPQMVALAKQSSSMKYNPVQLSDDALAGILRSGVQGYPDAK
jgi:alcohol dehydrogenase class IV